ncbi:putative ribosomal protein Rsm22, bacterial-type [Rosa chinensis]|uniref:Putative ribosomal protein Rsm22, bacterial-type n=1 Tax=Rosa chinensis TaxID=74649 RepID=A0A2P6P8Z3_ROSCH|nr:putative ribosomal protein Rsm22, bacterial-type [Rosa chinensis]
MPAVFSACHRVLKEVRTRLPVFSPAKVLDFGAGTSSAFYPIVMVHAYSRSNWLKQILHCFYVLILGQKNLTLIHSYATLQSMTKSINNSEREHDLVIAISCVYLEHLSITNLIFLLAFLVLIISVVCYYGLKSYVLGEIPSLKDRITVVRQLRDLTREVLKCRKSKAAIDETSKDLVVARKSGAYIVAPCSHDGACPLEKAGKYCHFVQRLERTST